MRSASLWKTEFRVRYFFPVLMLHLLCGIVFFTGVSPVAILVCFVTYMIRIFGITAGYHRYFSHRSFKTSRWFQFVLGWLGASAAQHGPLWWAGHHRDHHRHSDQEGDLHSPVRDGFWWSHFGWVFSRSARRTRTENIRDFEKYPEIRWLNRYYQVPPLGLLALMIVLGFVLQKVAPSLGTSPLQMAVWGFLISTILLYHATFFVNSLAHVWGSRRFDTKDRSRNNLWIALLTLGEGWHNNHHRFPHSQRQGLFWWEIDITHYVLSFFEKIGMIWDVKRPSQNIYDEARGQSKKAKVKNVQNSKKALAA